LTRRTDGQSHDAGHHGRVRGAAATIVSAAGSSAISNLPPAPLVLRARRPVRESAPKFGVLWN